MVFISHRSALTEVRERCERSSPRDEVQRSRDARRDDDEATRCCDDLKIRRPKRDTEMSFTISEASRVNITSKNYSMFSNNAMNKTASTITC